jgi:hypothetical protein
VLRKTRARPRAPARIAARLAAQVPERQLLSVQLEAEEVQAHSGRHSHLHGARGGLRGGGGELQRAQLLQRGGLAGSVEADEEQADLSLRENSGSAAQCEQASAQEQTWT